MSVGVQRCYVWCWQFTIVIARTRISFGHRLTSDVGWCAVWSVLRFYLTCGSDRGRDVLWIIVVVIGGNTSECTG